MDLDAISHDWTTHRFLVRELKRPGEPLDQAAQALLKDLALERHFTVWYLQLWNDGRIAWADMLRPETIDIVTPEEYREGLLRPWWENRYRLGMKRVEREPGQEG